MRILKILILHIIHFFLRHAGFLDALGPGGKQLNTRSNLLENLDSNLTFNICGYLFQRISL